MKLRFVADSKDVMLFVLFSILLLYIVAIMVLNFPSLINEGTFYGLNPFPAFQGERLKYTVVFFLLFLLVIFLSVSSYFFEAESGFGFSMSSKEKGYTTWATKREMKKALKPVNPTAEKTDYAGIPLISNGRELWVDNGEYHNLVIGATGSGKTVSTILPSVKILAKKGESIICTDPKGEIYEKTGAMLKEKGYNIILLNFRNPQKGNAWNPLSLPYRLYKTGNQDKAIELLDDLALNILYEENNGNADPFWEKTSADYFSGLALGMFEDTTEDKININSISLTTTVGEDKCGGSTYAKEYFNLKDPNSAAYINASGTIMAPSETKGSIIAVFKQKIKLFSSRENLSEMLSYSDFELESIGKVPTAVFIIIQDEKKTYHSLATIFIKQCYETLIDVAQQNGGKLPCRTNFLLDEFANMPPLKDVTTMITAARSRQIRFTMIIQNFAQLNQVYGKENAETIKGNCGNIIYLISTELAALEEISKLCGEVKSKKDEKTASTPLVTVSDLQRMKQFDQIVLRMRMKPFKTSFVPDFRIDWGKKYPLMDYPEREKKPVSVFDVREFVKAKKQQKMKEMMNEAFPSGDNPSGGFTDNKNIFDTKKESGGLFPPTTSANKKNNFNDDKSNFDVNELVKKIDAKIAEIEKEEKMKNGIATSTSNVSQNKESPRPVPPKLETTKPKIDSLDDISTNKKSSYDELFSSPIEKYNKPTKNVTTMNNTTTSNLLPIEEQTPKGNAVPEISASLIEQKVNNIIKSDLSTEFSPKKVPTWNDNIEKLDETQELEAIKQPMVAPMLEEKKEAIKEEIKEEITEEIKEEKKENIIVNIKEDEKYNIKTTPTIKLEDVSDDENFFDDFFED